jgi:hypothetical protein
MTNSVFIFDDLFAVQVDSSFQLLDAVMSGKIIFVDVVDGVASLPCFCCKSASLGLFGFELIQIFSSALKCFLQMSLLAFKS